MLAAAFVSVALLPTGPAPVARGAPTMPRCAPTMAAPAAHGRRAALLALAAIPTLQAKADSIEVRGPSPPLAMTT